MGICASTDAVAPTETTAKVILPDGNLREYPCTVMASEVLLHHQPSAFLCCADDMDLEGRLHAMLRDQDLEAGQIYFVLPKSMLGRRLRREEMAELDVKASATLTIGGDPYVSCKRRSGGGDVVKGGEEDARRRRRTRTASGRGRKFVVEMSATPE